MLPVPLLEDDEVVIGGGRYLSEEELRKPRVWLWSALNLGSGAGYGGSFCLLLRLLSSMPR